MPTEKCTLPGFDGVTVAWPDVWTMGHQAQYRRGTELAWDWFKREFDRAKQDGDEPDPAEFADYQPTDSEVFVFGVLRLAEVDGLEGVNLKAIGLKQLRELPLYYGPFLVWLEKLVRTDYLKATEFPKNSPSP